MNRIQNSRERERERGGSRDARKRKEKFRNIHISVRANRNSEFIQLALRSNSASPRRLRLRTNRTCQLSSLRLLLASDLKFHPRLMKIPVIAKNHREPPPKTTLPPYPREKDSLSFGVTKRKETVRSASKIVRDSNPRQSKDRTPPRNSGAAAISARFTTSDLSGRPSLSSLSRRLPEAVHKLQRCAGRKGMKTGRKEEEKRRQDEPRFASEKGGRVAHRAGDAPATWIETTPRAPILRGSFGRPSTYIWCMDPSMPRRMASNVYGCASLFCHSHREIREQIHTEQLGIKARLQTGEQSTVQVQPRL